MSGTMQVCGGALRDAASPQAVQPANRSLERADITSNTYWDWLINHAYLILAAQTIAGQFVATFKDFPPPKGAQLHNRGGAGKDERTRGFREALIRPALPLRLDGVSSRSPPEYSGGLVHGPRLMP